ncbi:cation diffusion facilitator family transporter [candidate division GN15 bacterium]|nr:cation diffusion facilitator family transporter [candidate division GN15 bacterium]
MAAETGFNGTQAGPSGGIGPDHRHRVPDTAAGFRVLVVGLLANLLLVALKGWVGMMARSQALIADAVHSISDVVTDIVSLVGLWWGRQEEDAEHPWGHGRIETFAGMLVGILLIAAAVGIAYSATRSLISGHVAPASRWVLLAAAISLIIKEAMYWYTVVVGRRLGSMVLIANAWHHRSDALSSLAVLIGAGASFLNPDWAWADPLAAIVVAYFVARVGIKLVHQSFREFVDAAPDPQLVERIRLVAADVPGVRDAHDIRSRSSGGQVFVEIHLVVDPGITVSEGHRIAKEVEAAIKNGIDQVTRVITHIDPDE